MKFHRKLFFIFLLLLSAVCVYAQEDSSSVKKDTSLFMKGIVSTNGKDTVPKHSPRKAAIRSAIIPGWGQIYNKKYWKLPIVYAALGITGYIFVDNIKTYKDLKFAYAAKYKASLPKFDSTSPYPGPYQDSSDYFKIDPRYLPISKESLRAGRNQFRQYIDYAAVFFVIFWGLNVVDAVVDAHLKAFDVSPDLSLKVKPSYNPFAKTAGLTLALKFR